jgi:ElaB/YqjD/DUF883 family membrane-anchored ribosome-binding protein
MERGNDSGLVEQYELREQIARVRTQIEDLDAQARRLVQERPLAAIGMALVLGYTLGRALARR